MACIQLHGYHSNGYSPFSKSKKLPSQEITFEIVKGLIKNNTPLIVRSKKWLDMVPELHKYSNKYFLKVPRNASVSAGNLENGAFTKICEALES